MDHHIIHYSYPRVRDLTPVDIARFIRDVMAGKTAVVEKSPKLRGKAVVTGGRGAAARSAGLLGGILSFAVSEGVIAANPAVGVKRPASTARTARLSPADYRALGLALEAAAQDALNPTAIAAVRLLALTGCRRGEVLGLRWSEVDEAGRAFRLTDSKEGASVRPSAVQRSRCGAVGTAAGSQWVLPGERRDLPYGGLKGVWRGLLQRAELAGVTLHTLRHSFAGRRRPGLCRSHHRGVARPRLGHGDRPLYARARRGTDRGGRPRGDHRAGLHDRQAHRGSKKRNQPWSPRDCMTPGWLSVIFIMCTEGAHGRVWWVVLAARARSHPAESRMAGEVLGRGFRCVPSIPLADVIRGGPSALEALLDCLLAQQRLGAVRLGLFGGRGGGEACGSGAITRGTAVLGRRTAPGPSLRWLPDGAQSSARQRILM